jgi:hypothetical protein
MAYLAVNTFGKGHDNPSLTVDGFNNDLITNGQGGDVYKHVYGHAGAILIGNNSARLLGKTGYQYSDENLALDIDQRDNPSKYPGHSQAEAIIEVNDTMAGRRIGALMGQRIHGSISRDSLRKQIFDILCAF